jgi:hypothetical protein
MWILGKHVSTLTAASLGELVQGGVGESQTLDYKSAFALSSDDEKKSLLADVTAMANTSGGIVLFGVETQRDANGKDTGIPIALPGLAGLNFDGERLKIESVLRTATSPSLTTQVFVKDIMLANGNTVIALGVSRSYLAPHRVAFKETNRFYRRGQGGNYQPEVAELRRMFLEQHEWSAEALALSENRSFQIAGSVGSDDGVHPVLVVHIVPLGRLDQVLDMRGRAEALSKAFSPLKWSGLSWEYNGEGVRIYTPTRGKPVYSYVQVFRNGIVEFASLGFGEPQNGTNKFQRVYGDTVAETLRKRLPDAIKQMRDALAVEPPYLVMIRVVNIHDARLAIDTTRFYMGSDHPIEEASLLLPPFTVDDPSAFSQDDLSGALDVLWQSAGYPEAPRPPAK